MKNLFLLFIAILLLQFNSLAQSGWVQQTSGTTENLNSVFFVNENVGWAVGENGVIIYTSDGGVNWLPQTSNTTHNFYSVKFMDEEIGWALGDGDVLKTTNGGENWNLLNAPVGHYYFLDNNIGFVAGEYYIFYFLKTTDGGSNWDTVNTWMPGIALAPWSMYFVNESIGFVNGPREGMGVPPGSMSTTNGGYSWSSLFVNCTDYPASFSFLDDSVGWSANYSGVNCVSKTTDSGENWEEQLNIVLNRPITDIFFANHSKGWISLRGYGFSSDSIMYTTDGGENWSSKSIGDTLQLNSIHFVDENIGWAVGENGTILYTTTGGVVSVEGETNSIPNKYNLTQNYPNPFNPSTKIKCTIPQTSNVVIKVFDILGNEIETLVNEEKPAGTYEITWYSEGLPSGVYFYRLQAGSFVKTKKMILMK